MTPTLVAMLASSRIDVPAAGLLLSTVQVVILPIVTGLVLRRYAPGLTRAVLPYGPFTSVVLITLIVASIIGSSRAIILESGDLLVVAVFLLHAGGFFFGYTLARLVSPRVPTARTVSIEVGMQNSGLGVVLAGQNFTSPLVAVRAPSRASSIRSSAAWWRASGGPAPCVRRRADRTGKSGRWLRFHRIVGKCSSSST